MPNSHKTEITVAVIALLSAIATALITSWDRLFGGKALPQSTTIVVQMPPENEVGLENGTSQPPRQPTPPIEPAYPKVKFNGIYGLLTSQELREYIDFDEDGSVSVIRSINGPADVFEYLNPSELYLYDPAYIWYGEYTVSKNTISFEVDSTKSKIIYAGTVDPNGLTLERNSISEEIRVVWSYLFYPVNTK